MNTTPKTPLTLLADAADEMHALTDRLTDAAEELLREPTPAPLALPTVDEVAAAIALDDGYPPHKEMDPEMDPAYLSNARAVLDLIAERVPVWKPVEPGTVIKAGTRYRISWKDGRYNVYPPVTYDVPTTDEWRDDRTYSIDPRTVPAEPEDPRGARARAIIPVLQKVKNVPLGGDLLPLALDAVDALDEMRADR